MNATTSNYSASLVPARDGDLSWQMDMLKQAVDRMTREKKATGRNVNRVTQRDMILSLVPIGIENAIGSKRLHGEADKAHPGMPTAKRFNSALSLLSDEGKVKFIQGTRCRLYYRNS